MIRSTPADVFIDYKAIYVIQFDYISKDIWFVSCEIF